MLGCPARWLRHALLLLGRALLPYATEAGVSAGWSRAPAPDDIQAPRKQRAALSLRLAEASVRCSRADRLGSSGAGARGTSAQTPPLTGKRSRVRLSDRLRMSAGSHGRGSDSVAALFHWCGCAGVGRPPRLGSSSGSASVRLAPTSRRH